jgi:hypothetical protein
LLNETGKAQQEWHEVNIIKDFSTVIRFAGPSINHTHSATMKPIFSILMLHGLRALALVARRQTPAPLITSDEVRHIDDVYVVRLQEGHTLDAHFDNIGVDLSRTATMFYPMRALNSYHARIDNHTIHELVRYDPGVESVCQDYYDDGEPRAFGEQGRMDIEGEQELKWKEEPKPSKSAFTRR